MTDPGSQLPGTIEAIANVGGSPVVVKDWPRLLTVEMAAVYLGLAEQTIRNKDIELPGKKQWGRKVVYDRRVIDRLIDNNNGSTDLWLDSLRTVK